MRGTISLCVALVGCAASSGSNRPHAVTSVGAQVVTLPVHVDDAAAPHAAFDTVARPPDVLAARVVAADPGQFALRVDERMQEIADRVRDEVFHGNLSPEADDEFSARSRAVRRAVHRAAADGVVTWQEQRQIDTMVRDLEVAAFSYAPMPRAWGGGPRYWR